MNVDVTEALPRPRQDRVVVEPGSTTYTVTTLREGGVGTGRSLAWFGAAAAENHLCGQPGFRGAAFMASDDDRFSFELTQWASRATLDATRRDNRYLDQLGILRSHGLERELGASADIRGGAPFPLKRGDVVVAEGFTVSALDAYEQLSELGVIAKRSGTFLHVTPGGDGGWFVLSMAKAKNLAPLNCGEESWSAALCVVDVISGHPVAAERQPIYRLLPAVDTRRIDSPEPSHG